MKSYRNFSIEQVGDGVFAVLAGSNAGIIDLGDQTLIFDTLSNLASAEELKQAAQELTGRPVSYVVVSHPHPDHYNGKQAFQGDAVIIGSATTRRVMIEEGAERTAGMKKSMIAEADSFRTQAEQAATEEDKRKFASIVAEYEEFFETYPNGSDLVVPELTYEHTMTFHGSKRTAQLITMGAAHSPCDAVLWLPEDRIVFAADLIIPGDNLIFLRAQPEQWPAALDGIEALGAELVVPGHRKVTSAKDGLAWSRDYLEYINRAVDDMIASGKALDSLDEIEAPKGCRIHNFRSNLRVLIERRLAQK